MSLQGDYHELNRIAEDAWFVAEESGWHRSLAWNPATERWVDLQSFTIHDRLEAIGHDRVLANLALIHSEVSEALEAVRKDPDHIGEELADVLIRTLELAHMLGIDIGHLTEAKMRKNRVRADVPARAGGKAI